MSSTKLILYVTWICSLFLAGAHVVRGDTAISGDIVQDTVWDKANNPYIISGNTVVTSGVTLTVHPGVTVKFDNNFRKEGRLHIQGRLRIGNSTSTEKVYIHSLDPSIPAGRITFFGSVMSTITNAEVSALRDGLSLNNSSLYISDSEFKDFKNDSNSVFTVFNSSILDLTGSHIHNIDTREAIALFDTVQNQSSRLSVSDSILENGTGDGIVAFSTTTVSISKSQIRNFNGSGIVSFLQPTITISDSTIEKNTNAGIHNTGFIPVMAKNNWWGNMSGPFHPIKNPAGTGNPVTDNVEFDPWEKAHSDKKCCSSIIFIPGLEASRLYVQGILTENQLWEPGSNGDVKNLFLNERGESVVTGIYTKDIIDATKIGGLNIYKNFALSMNAMVSEKKISEWQAIPYDWRQTVSSIIVGGISAKKENDFVVINIIKEIERMATGSHTGKVTLIAHSNGGLITKAIIKELEKQSKDNLIDKVILVAVPQLGTPLAIPSLLHGFDQSLGMGLVMSESVAKDLGQNMPSAYNLLPSRAYTERIPNSLITFAQSIHSPVKTHDELHAFLKNKSNSSLLAQAVSFHEEFDSYIMPSHISVIQIAGWGMDTVSGYAYTTKKSCGFFKLICTTELDIEPRFTQAGDSTVISMSALSMPESKYYIDLQQHNDQLANLRKNRNHASIFEVNELQDFIKSIITETLHVPSLITTTPPLLKDRIYISAHSPVLLDVYDKDGNHTGAEEERIPNSFYVKFGEGKYIGMNPADLDLIQVIGQDVGTFSLRIEKTKNDSTTELVEFKNVPVIPGMKAKVLSVEEPQLVIDIDNDGHIDTTVSYTEKPDQKKILKMIEKLVRKNKPKQYEKILEKLEKLYASTH